ncbi:MAG: alcohol dehydrogenase AdhP [Chloroflexota bacterium]
MLPRTMKAAVVHEFGKPLRIEEVSVPRPAAGQILVRVQASGVCHTDLHAANGDWPVKPSLPFIPGHEGVGYVAAVGPDVTLVKEGDRVGVPWLHSACGCCEFCLTGWETLCPNQQNTGYSVNGGYAEYVLAPAAYVGILPKEVDFIAAAPVLCAGVTTYKGLKETDTKPGDWVVIVGVGGLGHLAVQYARSMGLHVVAVDVADEKLDLASRLGAELTVNAAKVDPAAIIQKEIGGAHGVLVTAVSPKIFRQALDMLRRGGTCSLVGLPPGDFSTPIFDVVLKRLTIRGSIVGTRKDLQESLQFAAEGRIKSNIETQPLETINATFDRLEKGQINGRVVIDMGKEWGI